MVPVVDNWHDKTAQKCLFCVQWCYNLFKRFIYLGRATLSSRTKFLSFLQTPQFTFKNQCKLLVTKVI